MAQTGSPLGGPSAWRSRPSTRSRPGAVAFSAAASGCGWERSRWGWTACAATSRTCPCTSGSTSRKREEVSVSNEINIQFTRFSAFYSPLIATLAGGFLREAGFQPKHSVAPPGKSAIEALVSGTAHVAQSAPSQGFGPLEKGQRPPAVHFAQINEKDGFFLTARAADPSFAWDRLKGRRVLVDHGGEPLAMFTYACHRRGLAYAAITDPTVPWRPHRTARARLIAPPAAAAADPEAAFFPEIHRAVLVSTIASYQTLGCWTPHVEITRPAFEVALDVFQHAKLISTRHAYE